MNVTKENYAEFVKAHESLRVTALSIAQKLLDDNRGRMGDIHLGAEDVSYHYFVGSHDEEYVESFPARWLFEPDWLAEHKAEQERRNEVIKAQMKREEEHRQKEKDWKEFEQLRVTFEKPDDRKRYEELKAKFEGRPRCTKEKPHRAPIAYVAHPDACCIGKIAGGNEHWECPNCKYQWWRGIA